MCVCVCLLLVLSISDSVRFIVCNAIVRAGAAVSGRDFGRQGVGAVLLICVWWLGGTKYGVMCVWCLG